MAMQADRGGSERQAELIAVGELRIGMFIELNIGWMSHPFPMSSFRISSARQIETIRQLGLAQVRYFPEKSDAAPLAATWQVTQAPAEPQSGAAEGFAEGPSRQQLARRRAREQEGQTRCERRFRELAAHYQQVQDRVQLEPQVVRGECEAMVAGLVDELLRPGAIAIRLLSQGGGGRAAAHAANVTVLSLLLGRALELEADALRRLGMAALLHDIGKSLLPERVRHLDDGFSVAEYRLYRDHVRCGVELGQRMGLPGETLLAMAQHHEMVDGSGFPRGRSGAALRRLGRILAVTDRYDNLCNPMHAAGALTPHEAVSSLYSQMKGRLDEDLVRVFVRMLGVYPPGTVVQLSDERPAIVVMTQASHTLKPCILAHDPAVPRHAAEAIDLEQVPRLAIRRGIRPAGLSLESADYLMPPQRLCYFFESGRNGRSLA